MSYSFLGVGHRARVMRAVAGLTLAAGFGDLVLGGITFAALLLVAGYVVLVPLALLAE